MKNEILKYYPKAEDAEKVTEHYLKELEDVHSFDLENTLLATSICVDDINVSTEFRRIQLRPFIMGGLAGVPFVGLTGITAFAHHVPDDGYAFIFYGPHIGVTKDGTLGKIRRKGQAKNTTCCGALALGIDLINDDRKIQEEESDDFWSQYDYQESRLIKVLQPHKQRILKSEHPIWEATEVTYGHINKFMNKLVESRKSEFNCKKIALLGGIIINTDFSEDDFVEIRDFNVINI
nr:hypothetical protein [Saprospiraceae bacterium]